MARRKKSQVERRALAGDSRLTPVSPKRGNILLVDDDELLARIGEEMLACLGHKVVIRTSSLEALTSFQEAPEDFDLVLTDLSMPHMNGEVLARRLWDIRPDISIVLCTGNHDMTWKKARLLGFDALLTKPFGLSDLAAAIERATTQRTA